MIKLYSIDEFEDLKKISDDYYILDFYADWCGPCKLMDPIFEIVVEYFKNQKNLKFAKINRDENRELIAKYGFDIPTIPRFFLVKFNKLDNMEIVSKLGGTQGAENMIEQIEKIINNQTTKPTTIMENTTTHTNKKIAVIGSGPSGWTAAIYASRAQLETDVYTGVQPGGQLTTTTEIENFPGFIDGIMGPDLMMNMQKQAERFGTKSIYESVSDLKFDVDKKQYTLVHDRGETTYDGVIIASGASARYLGIENEERFIGKGYHSCATCDGFFYKNKIIAIVGGGDSAMEEANFLTKFGAKVYLIHRSDTYRASKIMLDRAKVNEKLEFIEWQKITNLIGKDKLEKIALENTKTGEKTEMVVDGLFVAIGHIPNSQFTKGSITMDEAGYLKPEHKTMSNIPGIFIAGDVEDTVYRQAITAAGDGCRAAMDLEKWLES
jgi:thioredoxin reductase (NADPH)